MNQKFTVRKLCIMGMFTAISVALAYFVHFPIFPAAPFLEYDPADITILIISFMYGPLYGVLMTLMVSGVQALTVSAQSGVIGFIMHFLASSAMAAVAGFVFLKGKTTKRAVLGLFFGALTMTVMMVPLNLIFTPMYGTPLQMVKDMMLPVILPFNLIKATGNGLLAFLLYRQIAKILKRDVTLY